MCASSLNKLSSQEGLKPCPFCGSAARLSYGRDNEVCNVRCEQWGVGICLGAGKNCYSEDEAIAAWNTRHPSFNDAIEAWQPIETAPKDATEIIGLLRPKVIRLVWWFAPSSRSQGWRDENSNLVKPTHWTPLPAVADTSADAPGNVGLVSGVSADQTSLNITGLDTGAVKTAESSHSPSTVNAETE